MSVVYFNDDEIPPTPCEPMYADTVSDNSQERRILLVDASNISQSLMNQNNFGQLLNQLTAPAYNNNAYNQVMNPYASQQPMFQQQQQQPNVQMMSRPYMPLPLPLFGQNMPFPVTYEVEKTRRGGNKQAAVCKFFLSGQCLNGDTCRFSHQR